MSRARNGPITQIGLVVENLDASIERWIDMMGVGPWTVFRNVTLSGQYRGENMVVRMDVGLSYQNDVQIELIHVTNGAHSPYLDASGKALAGLHHLAWIVDDLDVQQAQAVADGLSLVFRAESPGTRVAYFEAPGEGGLLFEYIEGASTKQLIAEGIAKSRAWDGSDPVSEIDFAKM